MDQRTETPGRLANGAGVIAVDQAGRQVEREHSRKILRALVPGRSLGRHRTLDSVAVVNITAMRKIEEPDGGVFWLVQLEGCERELVLTSNQLLWRGEFDRQTLIQVGRLFARTTADEWALMLDRALARYVRGEVEQ